MHVCVRACVTLSVAGQSCKPLGNHKEKGNGEFSKAGSQQAGHRKTLGSINNEAVSQQSSRNEATEDLLIAAWARFANRRERERNRRESAQSNFRQKRGN